MYNQIYSFKMTDVPLYSTIESVQSVGGPPEFPKYSLLNVWLNTLTMGDIQELITRHIRNGHKFVLANQNLHGVYIANSDAKAREFFASADYTHIDGTSLVFLGKIAGLPFRNEHRCGYMDLFPYLLPGIIANGWRVFYLGSKPEVLELALARLHASHPNLQIAGHHGFFNKSPGHPDNERVITRINEFRPDILFVGMGMPIQEHWIHDHLDAIDAHAILHCGGLMDYIAGEIITPPRWLGPIGLEWLFRLCTEPRRLWRRYLLEPLLLLPTIGRHLFRRRN